MRRAVVPGRVVALLAMLLAGCNAAAQDGWTTASDTVSARVAAPITADTAGSAPIAADTSNTAPGAADSADAGPTATGTADAARSSAGTGPAAPQAGDTGITAARFEAPADVYPHRIMGDIREKLVLAVRDGQGREYRADLRDRPPGRHVFEDIAPRVVDADGDGRNDAVVVETDPQAGAMLAVYALRQGRLEKIAATPAIGQPFRWLAPVAVADLDGNGVVDIAYVETPHLDKRLRVWSWAPGGLTEIARLDGVTNHRIGEETISGGLRTCGEGPEMVLAAADWSGLVAVRLGPDGLTRRDLPGMADRPGFVRALACGG